MDEIILTSQEEKKLQEYEAIIQTEKENIGQGHFRIGIIFADIREAKLYQKIYPTFEEYCKERWGLSKRHVDRLILSAKTIENLKMGPIGLIPNNEAQTRPLTRLPTPELQQEAWKEAVETAPEGKITARHVSRIVSKTLGEEVKKKMKKRRKKIKKDELISDEFQKAFDGLVSAMHNERATGWKTTSKEAVLEHLEALKNILLIGG